MRLTARHITKMNGVQHTHKYRVTDDEDGNVRSLEVKLEKVEDMYVSYSGDGYSDVEPKDVPTEISAEFINRLEGVAEDLRA